MSVPMADEALRSRSIRTLAWLGDAQFEREVRWRVARRGDYPTDRLDTVKAAVVRAEAQAALLEDIEAALTEDEAAIVRRGRNAAVPPSARGRGNTQAYRASTALEALVAHWTLAGDNDRFESILAPPLERAIDAAVSRHAKRIERG